MQISLGKWFWGIPWNSPWAPTGMKVSWSLKEDAKFLRKCVQFELVKFIVLLVCLRAEFVSFIGSVYGAVILSGDQTPRILLFGSTYALRNVINFQ